MFIPAGLSSAIVTWFPRDYRWRNREALTRCPLPRPHHGLQLLCHWHICPGLAHCRPLIRNSGFS